MMKKPNRNSPATPEQCVAAHEAGVSEGTAEGLAIYLTVMRDKFGKSTDAAYKIYQRTVYQCDAIKIDGHIIARYERELREFLKCDICPQMKNIAKAYKQPRQPIKVKDVEYSRRQAGSLRVWFFCWRSARSGNTPKRSCCAYMPPPARRGRVSAKNISMSPTSKAFCWKRGK